MEHGSCCMDELYSCWLTRISTSRIFDKADGILQCEMAAATLQSNSHLLMRFVEKKKRKEKSEQVTSREIMRDGSEA